uniref:Uncharacterized protein n=2 Tax=Lygus hesperus TaxID=30085 RepID=A0A0K8SW73_LYGHE
MHAAFVLIGSALLVAFVSGAPSANVKEIVQNVSKKCAAETKASPEQAKIAVSQHIPKDDVERCYLQCVYTGVGVIKDGKFSEEGGKKLVALRFHDAKEKELANKLIATCAKEIKAKDGEKCSLGRAVRECFVNHGNKSTSSHLRKTAIFL